MSTLLIDCLAVRAVPVPAGIRVDFCVPAFRADTDVVPKGTCFALDDSVRRLFLDGGLEDAAFTLKHGK